ncbi:radical SAM protein [Clostridium paraputrificum]|uniref:radical SAM protein n=1 Tax=Clostridium paraputrificum TaxID=29363 RepID=UPI003D348490
MVGIEKDWREKEASLKEVIKKYSDVSSFVIIKADVQRRGVIYTKRALDKVDTSKHQVVYRGFATEKDDNTTPMSLLLRDGTSILSGPLIGKRDPYTVDVVDGKIVLVDDGEVIEEVEYWEKPDYYDKLTSSGKPMWQIVAARPQRLDINPNQYCHFWDKPGHGCKFCAIQATYSKNKNNKPKRLDINDIAETVKEALKEKGRYTSIFLTGGSILSGNELLDDEVDLYISILKEIGKNFKVDKFPSQLIGTAFNEKQIKRLYDNTGLTSYTADIEVLDENIFNWVCPGKAEMIGYKEWKERLYKAVEIFGVGNVNTGIVSGIELAKPYGYKSEEEALEAMLKEAEDLAKHGVSVVSCVWNVIPGSIFFDQKSPSLEYYIKLSVGLDKLRRKYGLNIDMDNYRRCGNHPDTDLSRI